jgi:Subtilase family
MSLRGAVAVLLLAGILTAFLPDAANARQLELATPPAPAASPSPQSTNAAAAGGAQWPLKSLDATALWQRTRQGAGVKIAVVDTGIYAGSRDLKSVVMQSRDLLGRGAAPVAPDSHGTEVAELIAGSGVAGPAGLSPAVSVLDVRVAVSLPKMTAAAIAAGIGAASNAGAQVINVSVGVSHDTATLLAAVRSAEREGRLVVASAGGSGTALYPAAIPGVLSVGTENQQGDRSEAPRGTALFAPGAGLFPNLGGTDLGALNGSDYAAAYVSAAAALLLSASSHLTPPAAGSALTAAAGASKLLDPDRALPRASAPRPAPTTPRPSPAQKRAGATQPSPGSAPVLTYLLSAVAVVIVLFAAYLVFLARRTRRTAISVSGAGTSSASQPQPQQPQPGDDRVLQPRGHEPFSWDQSW